MFEDTAAEYLRRHPEVKAELEKRKATDTAFAHDASAQLDFVYNHSQYAEPGYLRYPVYRIK